MNSGFEKEKKIPIACRYGALDLSSSWPPLV